MNNKTFICTILFFLAGSFFAAAQPGINSIYSAYGIGDVSIRDMNSYAPMGGVGIAVPSNKILNTNNPASYSSILRGSYIMELSASGKSINYKNETQTFKANDFVINGAALGFSIAKKMGGAVSLKRYSTVEYYTLANRYLNGSNAKLSEDITGSGGLYVASLGVGLKLTKNLSAGVSGGSIFGSVNKKENIYTSTSDGFVVENNSFYNNFYSNAGIQYRIKKGKYNWIIGATLQPTINLIKEDDYYIKDFSDNIVYQEKGKKSSFEYPMQWGLGISAEKNNSMLSADYIQQNWSATKYKGSAFKTTNLQNIAIGFKHTYKQHLYNYVVDGITFMCGVQAERSYIVINNYRVQSYSVSSGITIPSKKGLYNYTLGLKYGQRGQVSYPLVKENFIECNVALSLGNFLNFGGLKYF